MKVKTNMALIQKDGISFPNKKFVILHITEEVVCDITQTHMATEFNLQPIIIHDQQVLLLFVGTELIVSVKIGEELVRVMAEWQDGIDKIHGLL